MDSAAQQLDSGVDTTNPDFTGNVSNGNPKVYQAFDFQNMEASAASKKKSCAVVSIILRGTKTRPDFNRVIKKISRKGL